MTEAWVHRYNNVVSNSIDQAYKVVSDAAGDVIMTGTSGLDMLSLKYPGADGDLTETLCLWRIQLTTRSAKDTRHA